MGEETPKTEGAGHVTEEPTGETPPKHDDSKWTRAVRLDLGSGEFTETKTTPQGGLAVRANLTRTGVFEYRQPDGSTRREYRPPEEVFAPDSLATLAHATMTEEHPTKVTPGNWKAVSIGHVAGVPARAGKFVQGEVHIQHGDSIDKAKRGQLREV